MFRKMRRADKEKGPHDITRILCEGEYGVLSTLGENGYPYSTPLNYTYFNDSIYFHSATAGQKLDNISYNEKVCFCVVGKTEVIPEEFSTKYESVIIFGKASFVEGEEKKDVFISLVNKYSKDFMKEGIEYIDRAIKNTSVIKITIDSISGKGIQ
jgi:nitroimidazol reductase NimA-like FMN-containing flavoprotein (pyridoxamine 5'-phosphate oxidase superfamily)